MPTTLPGTPEAITPAWLSATLGAARAGASAESVGVIGAHSGTTGRAVLRVAWSAGAGLPERIFVKLPPTDATQRSMVDATDMGRREARFYAGLAQAVSGRVPGSLRSGWGD